MSSHGTIASLHTTRAARGRWTRRGPYDVLVDVEDFEALAEELGGDAVAVLLGDGRDRARHEPSLLEGFATIHVAYRS